MSWTCDAVEAVLAMQGQAALDHDSEIQQHVDECTGCQATLAALDDLDSLLGELPAIEPPAAAVQELLEQPELRATEEEPTTSVGSAKKLANRRRQTFTKYSSAVAATLLALIAGYWLLVPPARYSFDALAYTDNGKPTLREKVWSWSRSENRPAEGDLHSSVPLAVDADPSQQRSAVVTDIVFGIPDTPQTPAPDAKRKPGGEAERSASDKLRALGYLGMEANAKSDQDERLGGKAVASGAEKKDSVQINSEPSYDKVSKVEEFDDSIEVVGELEEISQVSTLFTTVSQKPAPSPAEFEARLLGVPKVAPRKAKIGGRRNEALLDSSDGALGAGQELDERPSQQARHFLEQLRRTDQLQFQSPTGYWSNSYLPGDSELRLLRAQLEQWDRSTLEEQAQTRLRLHDAAQPLAPPFDAPDRAALALYLNADQGRVEGESRVLLQVGLRSTERRRGQRPAMNIAVVLDLTEVPTGEQIDGLQALLFALDQARQPGDRFHLLTSFDGGELRPEEFRHGPLRLFLDDLSTAASKDQQDAFDPDDEDLRTAFSQATDRVARGDDPNAPWGSSSLLLLTDRWPGDLAELENLARRNAVAGIALSTVALGDAEQAEDFEPLALAGQGRRWWIGDPSHAAEVARREVEAVGQVVARALRLNIRLAAGVRLVEIYDSQPLNALRSEQVRQSERAIDLRLARNLGITSDRDRDDEGIQIVIPAFQADDSHTVLLDLVVPGPGAVAEVTLRYKDLVRLRNGTAREQLNLRAGQRQPGPLQLSVLRGRLKIELRDGLRQAAEALLEEGPDGAAQQLQKLRRLLAGLGQEIPALAGDRDLDSELAMIDDYLTALATAGASDQQWQLVDSLRYAGQLGIKPPPTPVKPD